jgi:FHA domain-containing protein
MEPGAPTMSNIQAEVTLRDGDAVPGCYLIEPGEYFVGRDSESCSLVLDSAGVSRKHARLFFDGEQLIVEDVGSRNGTFVDGWRLDGPMVLDPGHTVGLGIAGTMQAHVVLAEPEPEVAHEEESGAAAELEEMGQLAGRLAEAQSAIDSLGWERDQAIGERDHAAARLESLAEVHRSRLAALTQQRESMARRHAEEIAQLRDAAEARARELTENHSAALEEKAEALEQLARACEAQQQRAAVFEERIEMLRHKRAEAESRLAQQNEAQRQRLVALERELESALRDRTEKTGASDQLARALEAQQQQAAVFEEQIDVLRRERAEAEARFAQHDEAQRQRLGEVERDLESALRDRAAKAESLDQLARGFEAQQQRAAVFEEQIDMLRQKRAEAEARLAQQNEAHRQRLSSLEQKLEAALRERAAALEVPEQRAASLEQQLGAAAQEREAAQLAAVARVAEVERELFLAAKQRDDARARLERVDEARSRAEFLLSAKSVLLEKLQAAAKKEMPAGDERSERKEIARLNARIAALEEQLAMAMHRQPEIEAAREVPPAEPDDAPGFCPQWLLRQRAWAGGLIVTVLVCVTIFATKAAFRARDGEQRARQIVLQLEPEAPHLYAEALALMKARAFDKALPMLSHATTLVPERAEYHFVEGNLYESLLEIAEARDCYVRVLRLDPAHAGAQENLRLCDRLLLFQKHGGKLDTPPNLYALHRLMMKQGRLAEALAMADRLSADKALLCKTWKAVLDEAGIGGVLALNPDGTLALDLSGTGIADLSVLAEMPISNLKLARTQVTDLTPLAGMPLRKLDLSDTRVSNLEPLRGTALESLNLAGTRVADLDPLMNMLLRELVISGTPVIDLHALSLMPLHSLHMSATRIRDITPLAKLPLEELSAAMTQVSNVAALRHLPLSKLDLSSTPVSDLDPLAGAQITELRLSKTPISRLDPLRGMPLRELTLAGCGNVRDVSPLASCQQLERLVLPSQCAELAPLRELPRLRFLSYEKAGIDAQYDQTAVSFWSQYRSAKR